MSFFFSGRSAQGPIAAQYTLPRTGWCLKSVHLASLLHIAALLAIVKQRQPGTADSTGDLIHPAAGEGLHESIFELILGCDIADFRPKLDLILVRQVAEFACGGPACQLRQLRLPDVAHIAHPAPQDFR